MSRNLGFSPRMRSESTQISCSMANIEPSSFVQKYLGKEFSKFLVSTIISTFSEVSANLPSAVITEILDSPWSLFQDSNVETILLSGKQSVGSKWKVGILVVSYDMSKEESMELPQPVVSTYPVQGWVSTRDFLATKN